MLDVSGILSWTRKRTEWEPATVLIDDVVYVPRAEVPNGDTDQMKRDVTIPLGAKVTVTRQDGSLETYKFLGGNPLVCQDAEGNSHSIDVLDGYTSLEVTDPDTGRVTKYD